MSPLVDYLARIVNDLYDVVESAEDCGWTAVQHKAEEALGRAESALNAARQYADGTLTARDV